MDEVEMMKEELASNVRKVLRNPKRLFRGLNRLWYSRLFTRPYNTEGIDIFEEDWDNLIILDACRYDLFEEKVDVERFDNYERKTSRGSSSYEFVKANFFDRDLMDTVYLTANGHVFWMEDELDSESKFHEKIMLENKGDGPFSPESVRNQVLENIEEFDDKRLMIHFMQPHYPFTETDDVPDAVPQFWSKVFNGEINSTDEQLWQGYSRNFDRVWPKVEKLIDELDGKTIVTADHGNMFGERSFPFPIREYGHPPGIYDEPLVKVPWLTVDGERRNILKGESQYQENYDEEEIKDQLAELGYGE